MQYRFRFTKNCIKKSSAHFFQKKTSSCSEFLGESLSLAIVSMCEWSLFISLIGLEFIKLKSLGTLRKNFFLTSFLDPSPVKLLVEHSPTEIHTDGMAELRKRVKIRIAGVPANNERWFDSEVHFIPKSYSALHSLFDLQTSSLHLSPARGCRQVSTILFVGPQDC